MKDAMRIIDLEEQLKWLRLKVTNTRNIVLDALQQIEDGNYDDAIEHLRSIAG